MRSLLTLLVAFGTASLLGEAALFGVLYAKGLISTDKLHDMLTVVYDVDLAQLQTQLESEHPEDETEQPSLHEIQMARKLAHLDLDLVELGADKGWNELRELSQTLSQQFEEYQQLKRSFEESLVKLDKVGEDVALRDVKTRLEVMNPKQAKEQIVKILDDEAIGEAQATEQVIHLLQAMAPDRKKKILTEFKSDEDAGRLHKLLKHIREGVADRTLIRETRAKFQGN